MHQIFGGYLRSQVTCTVCQRPSNTYDEFLDLSVDVLRANSVVRALRAFVRPEALDGDNRYHCERYETHARVQQSREKKRMRTQLTQWRPCAAAGGAPPRCQRKVAALKRLTVHEPPNVLTVHLKRFDPFAIAMGGKISRASARACACLRALLCRAHCGSRAGSACDDRCLGRRTVGGGTDKHVHFDEWLSLAPYMSQTAVPVGELIRAYNAGQPQPTLTAVGMRVCGCAHAAA